MVRLSTISLDCRTDLPKVKYATALDWFLLMSFFYCIATLLEFAGVHYFTKVGSGEIPMNASDDEEEWESVEEIEEIGGNLLLSSSKGSPQRLLNNRLKNSIICPIYNEAYNPSASGSHLSTMERSTGTQTEPPKKPKWVQFWLCFIGNDKFRKERAREATAQSGSKKHVNSVSLIDRTARVVFPCKSIGQCLTHYLMNFYCKMSKSRKDSSNLFLFIFISSIIYNSESVLLAVFILPRLLSFSLEQLKVNV